MLLNIYFYDHNSNNMKTYAVLVMLLSCLINVSAQDTNAVRRYLDPDLIPAVDAALTVHIALPSERMQQAIENRMGNLGFGASLLIVSNPFSWGRKPKNSPLRIGGEIGYTYYGRFISEVDINGFRGDYKTSYGIANLNAVLRFRSPVTGGFNPFVDIIAGGNFYFSSTKENLSALETALGIESIDLGGTSSASFNNGIGFGFTAGSAKPEQVRFTLRATYNRGSTIKYVVRNSLAYDAGNNRVTYERGRAPVEFFMIQVGIGI
jgi:hypothetical protein